MPKARQRTGDHLGRRLGAAIDMTNGRIKQVDVAKACGVTAASVSGDWLKYGRISKEHYPKLVNLFRLPYEWWFGPAGADEKITKTITYMVNMTENGKDEVVRVAANTVSRFPRIKSSPVIADDDNASQGGKLETQPARAKGSGAPARARRGAARGSSRTNT
jgi:hypothetical protein